MHPTIPCQQNTWFDKMLSPLIESLPCIQVSGRRAGFRIYMLGCLTYACISADMYITTRPVGQLAYFVWRRRNHTQSSDQECSKWVISIEQKTWQSRLVHRSVWEFKIFCVFWRYLLAPEHVTTTGSLQMAFSGQLNLCLCSSGHL